MFPILMGLGIGALMGGGVAALQKKNVLEGALMGAAGGAAGSFLMPAAGAAAGAAGTPTAGAAAVNAFESALPGLTEGASAMAPMGTVQAGTAGIGGFGGFGNIGDFLTANKGALMGGGLGGMMAKAKEPDKKSEGNIYDMSFSQERNPLFGQPGQEAFINQGYKTNSITPVEDYKPTMMAANGGIIALAEGGGLETQRYDRPMRQVAPEVAAYNAKLMERANQQYNVNLPPAPNQVPGFDSGLIGINPPQIPEAPITTTGTASSDSISGLTFNPITQQYEGDYSAPGKKKEEVEKESGYRPYESWASGSGGEGGANASGGNNDGGPGAGSDAGGNLANGGLMRGYNQGGISSLGTYSDGGQLLRGPGDGVSDDIPAQIGARQPARLADGEFVVPARVVSELGNGSTDAGAKRLYAMMDRVQNNRRKSVGKGKVAVDSKAYKHLPA